MLRKLAACFARWRADLAERDAGIFLFAAVIASAQGDVTKAREFREHAQDALRRRSRWRRAFSS